jgi:Sulfotransferase family
MGLQGLDAGRLVEGASEQAGLDDFGPDGWREGLDTFVASLEAEADLSELGEIAIGAQITTNLTNRLQVVAWLAEHPSALAEPIERPIIVLGLPRTGTTLVSELLHRDPANRSLLRWEAMSSVPPPKAAELATDPRIAEARVAMDGMDALNPGFKAIHYEAPDGPTEDVAVLSQDFRSQLWSVVANVGTYDEWLLQTDWSTAYDYHRSVLALLQSSAPGRWSLKTPNHCLALDEVVAHYPDARLVMTHRDPVTVVASVCSLVRSLSGTFSDVDHGAAINERWTRITEVMVDRVMEWRDANGDDRFVDVDYGELVADPVASVQRVYERFGEELSPAANEAMDLYMAEHPPGEHGRHRYRLEELGLDAGAIDERFARYTERFDLGRSGEHVPG